MQKLKCSGGQRCWSQLSTRRAVGILLLERNPTVAISNLSALLLLRRRRGAGPSETPPKGVKTTPLGIPGSGRPDPRPGEILGPLAGPQRISPGSSHFDRRRCQASTAKLRWKSNRSLRLMEGMQTLTPNDNVLRT